MYEAWHNPNLALARSDNAWAIRTDESGLRLCLEHVGNADHVMLGYALGDADDEGDFGSDGLFDAGGC